MTEYDIYYDREFIGRVWAPSIEMARCQAVSLYEPLDSEGHGTWDLDELETLERPN
jgi:hypothetical protein